jgi:hypothetical protein
MITRLALPRGLPLASNFKGLVHKWDCNLPIEPQRYFLLNVPPISAWAKQTSMRKKPKSGNNLPLVDLPPDENVKIPSQVSHTAAVANARATGQPMPPKPKPDARRRFPHSDADIDQALQRLKKGALQVGDPEFDIVRDLAEEGARHIKSRRRGAQQPRENSNIVTRRMEALVQGYRELSPKMQAHPNGAETIRKLRKSVIKKLDLSDQDDLISEEMIKHDMRQLGPIFRLVREGKMPQPGPKPVKQRLLSKETQREMIAGKRALAKHRSGL